MLLSGTPDLTTGVGGSARGAGLTIVLPPAFTYFLFRSWRYRARTLAARARP